VIIISMYREHLLSIQHVQKLLYHQVETGQNGRRSLRAPPFFISQNDKGRKGEFFPRGSEAERMDPVPEGLYLRAVVKPCIALFETRDMR
jgi:hypothetical protein